MRTQFSSKLIASLIALALGIVLFTNEIRAAGDEELKKKDETSRQVDELFLRGDWAGLDTIGSQYVRAYEKDSKQFAAMRTFFYVLPIEKTSDVLEGYNAWVKRFPNSYVALYARARYHAYQAMAARGEETIDKVPVEQLQKMQGHFAAADADIRRSLAFSSRPVMSYFQLIRIARYYGTPKNARAYYEKSASLDPDVLILADEYLYSAQPRWGGSFKELQNFPDDAMKQGLSPAKVVKLRAHARFLEAEDALFFGDKKRASKLYAEVVNDGSSKEYVALALVELGRMADTKRDFEISAGYYNQALSLKPNDVRVLVGLAAAKRDANRPHEAIALYDRAISLAPDDRWALAGRGWVQHKVLGNNEAAFPDMLKAAKLGEPSAQNVLGFLYWEGTGTQKNQAEALYWWTLSAKQNNETAVENLRMAKRRLGDGFDTLRNAALRAKQPSQTLEITRP